MCVCICAHVHAHTRVWMAASEQHSRINAAYMGPYLDVCQCIHVSARTYL